MESSGTAQSFDKETMDDAEFIIGLMKSNTAALGFIPSTAIRDRWIKKGRYVIQRDTRGRARGYILHGPPTPGRPLYINQACIDLDHRLHGFGILAVRQIVTRAIAAGVPLIKLRCAFDLPANHFWHACGFYATKVEPGGKRRNREIVSYQLELADRPLILPAERAISILPPKNESLATP